MQGKLSLDRIKTSGGWPKLKAKAAATRHLAPFALGLAIEHDTGSPRDRRRVAVAQLLINCYNIIHDEGMFMSEAARRDLPEIGRRLCSIYGQLSAEASSAERKRWRFSPKHHLFQHLCEWQGPEDGNPRFFWVYFDEDLVGKIIEVAHSCHPLTMPQVSMFKWGLFFADDIVEQHD